MCSQKILCLPPVANILRYLDMRFTWVKTCLPQKHIYNSIENREITKWGLSDFDIVKDFLYNVCEK